MSVTVRRNSAGYRKAIETTPFRLFSLENDYPGKLIEGKQVVPINLELGKLVNRIEFASALAPKRAALNIHKAMATLGGRSRHVSALQAMSEVGYQGSDIESKQRQALPATPEFASEAGHPLRARGKPGGHTRSSETLLPSSMRHKARCSTPGRPDRTS